MSEPRTEPDDLTSDVSSDVSGGLRQDGPDDPDTALVEEVSIDGMCGVY